MLEKNTLKLQLNMRKSIKPENFFYSTLFRGPRQLIYVHFKSTIKLNNWLISVFPRQPLK